jgi:hypothetical protein
VWREGRGLSHSQRGAASDVDSMIVPNYSAFQKRNNPILNFAISFRFYFPNSALRSFERDSIEERPTTIADSGKTDQV